MDFFLDAIRRAIAAHSPLPPGARVLVGLSGGPDSVLLLHALKRLGFEVAAAHLDHGWRAESASEAAWIGDRCREWAIPFHGSRIAITPETGREDAARQARHAYLQTVAREAGYAAIALGHHADDQAETMLFRLARGTGPAGLAGMRIWRPTHACEGGVPLLRPMLELTRAQIESQLAAWRLPALTDPSNADRTFARNRLRHEVLPVLKSINPDATTHMSRLAGMLQEEEALGEETIDRLAKFIVRSISPLGVEIERRAFLALPSATRRRLLRWVLTQHGGPAGDHSWLEAAIAVAEQGGGTDLAGGWRISVETPWLVLTRPSQAEVPAPVPVATVRLGSPDTLAAWGWQVTVGDQLSDRPAGPTVVRFDADALPADGVFRTAQPDLDHFCPWGHRETHSLRHFLGRCRVPRHRQDTLLVLASGTDVYWVVGYRRGSQASLTRTPENVCEMQATAGFPV